MPLNSIQYTVRGILDGLAIPGGGAPLEAYITPPTVEDLNGPKAYIWGSRCKIARQTMPRGQGFKKLDWDVDIWLSYETTPDSATVDQEFPLIVDAVMQALWTTPLMNRFMTDPTTGLKSQLLGIGEDFSFEYPPEHTPNTLRMLYYMARLSVNVLEAVQF